MEDNAVTQPAELPAAAEAAEARPSEDETLRRERDEYYDLLLRKTAEFDNYRKRVERERAEMREQAAEDLLRDLLPLVDNLERALNAPADEASVDAYRRGVELIHQQMLDLLRKRGVTPIEAVGRDFDPNLHEAVQQVSAPDHRPGEVLEEFTRGYMLGSRLLRPSAVKVAA